MAAIGVGAAPDDYDQTPAAKQGLAKIRRWFANNPPANMHNRAMKMMAPLVVEDLMTKREREAVVEDLLVLQKDDGGWNLATLGTNWIFLPQIALLASSPYWISTRCLLSATLLTNRPSMSFWFWRPARLLLFGQDPFSLWYSIICKRTRAERVKPSTTWTRII